MEKSFNMKIHEIRMSLIEEINNYLKEGIPVTVIQLILENLLNEVEHQTNNILELEKIEIQKQLETQKKQMKWEDPKEEQVVHDKESED